ncbi:universal stress protein [Rhizobium sp. CNPSo 3968]|uniref:universal stress protein n=1 Tax=Rhizobium sp. CNPSo 3968 TaxID=3021408 RepID=UPI000DDC40CA|nr:universal stress protein [Rhizobium sp. CNPSo 3968]MDK4718827.1 universal stress protein [Rhizobium sp. CNPSo 3968]
MACKTLLCVTAARHGDQDLQTAISLSTTMEAHLVLLVVAFGAMPPYSGYSGETASIWIDERGHETALLNEKIETAKARLTAAGISYEVQEFFCDFPWAPDLLGQRAMYADMTIIGAEMAADEDLRAFAIDGVLFHSPTPALIVPKCFSPVWPPRIVMVAWNARVEAAGAVHKALDALKAAERVHVAMVDPVALTGLQGEEPGADIATYLARHGAEVSVDVIASETRSTDEALLRHGVDVGADLIVMGAYGHSRMRERIFGGVTRAMLEHAKLPIFLGR